MRLTRFVAKTSWIHHHHVSHIFERKPKTWRDVDLNAYSVSLKLASGACIITVLEFAMHTYMSSSIYFSVACVLFMYGVACIELPYLCTDGSSAVGLDCLLEFHHCLSTTSLQPMSACLLWLYGAKYEFARFVTSMPCYSRKIHILKADSQNVPRIFILNKWRLVHARVFRNLCDVPGEIHHQGILWFLFFEYDHETGKFRPNSPIPAPYG